MSPIEKSEDCLEDAVYIKGINSTGKGVGKLKDGSIVFVPRTVPGDTVKVSVTKRKSRWSQAKLIDVMRPSVDRVESVCPHYDSCNGCALQHMDYRAQLKWKINKVEESFRRIAGIEISVSGIQNSPNQYGYRSRLSFTLLRLPDSRIVAGFHSLWAPNRIEDIVETCSLGEETLNLAWKSLRQIWGEGARLLPSGRKLRLTLRTVQGGIALIIQGGKGPGNPKRLMSLVSEIVSIWSEDSRGNKRLLAGSPILYDERIGEIIEVGPTDFLQANRSCEILLNEWVCDQIEPCQGLRVIDAYCGFGPFGRRLMTFGCEVIGIERDLENDFDFTNSDFGTFNCLKGTAEDILPGVLPADAVILNPPRIGLDQSVTTIMCENGPPLIIYVSCDPATMARDLGRMIENYEIKKIKLFDLFPQTPHTETVAVLARRT